MEGEGVALGRPKDGEGNLESETAEGKLLMCSLFTGGKKDGRNKGAVLQDTTTGSQESPIYPPDRPWLGEKAALRLLCRNSSRNGQRC